jgi:thiamine-monophosphate kinase
LSFAETLGERKIIQIFIDSFRKMPKMALPFGDDVAAIDIGKGRLAVLKSDMLVDRTDAPKEMTPWQIGRKAVVVTVSDFASKGVAPMALLTSVGMPRKFLRGSIEQLALGIEAGAREYGVHIIGGDTDEASDLVVDCLGFGLMQKGRIVSRSGARPGDILAVTGLFGETSAGLKILLDKIRVPRELRTHLVKTVLLPKAQLRLGLALARSGALTSSIDSSDGLAWSLYELSRMSRVGFVMDNLPVSLRAKRFAEITGTRVKDLVLHGGEEFNLVVTIRPSGWNKAMRATRRAGGTLHRIGEVTRKRRVVLRTPNAKESRIAPVGWEHFVS